MQFYLLELIVQFMEFRIYYYYYYYVPRVLILSKIIHLCSMINNDFIIICKLTTSFLFN